MSIADYLEWYILYIPKGVYVGGIVAFLLVLAVAILWRGRKEGVRLSAAFLMAEYVALLLYFTVYIWRGGMGPEYILVPFWSYWAVFHGTKVLAHEIIMNIAVFIPIGVLAAIALKRATWKKVALVGLAISLTIELLQLILERGYCETDDVINNTLGCLIGYGMVRLAVRERLAVKGDSTNHSWDS